MSRIIRENRDEEADLNARQALVAATRDALGSRKVLAPYFPRDLMAGDPASPSGTKVAPEELEPGGSLGSSAPGVQNLSILAAIPETDREDKQTRLVEDEGAIYRFDANVMPAANPPYVIAPTVGTGRWLRTPPTGGANGYAGLDAAGTVPDAQIPAAIARDAEVVAAVVAGIAAHEAAPDPHPGYQLEAEKGAASGYAPLDAGARLPTANLTIHAATHQHGGADEVATAAPAANAIPKATAAGKLSSGWGGAASSLGTLDALTQQPLAELKAMVGATAIADGARGSVPQPLTGQQRRFLRADGTWADLGQDIATSSVLATTTSLTDVLITGMSITPPAGTYLVWFNGGMTNTSVNTDLIFSIYAAGVQATDSERLDRVSTANRRRTVMTMVRVTVDGTQAIDARWRTTGGTAQVYGRGLMILRVA